MSQEESTELIEEIIYIFKLLQLFCEGHNQQMQNFLAVQLQDGKPKRKSFNFIKYSAQ